MKQFATNRWRVEDCQHGGRKETGPLRGDGFLVEQRNVVGRWIDAGWQQEGGSLGGGEARTAVRHPHALFLRPFFLPSPSRFSFLASRFGSGSLVTAVAARVARFCTSCFAVNRIPRFSRDLGVNLSRAQLRATGIWRLSSASSQARGRVVACLLFPLAPRMAMGT